MIDILSEDTMTLAKASRSLPEGRNEARPTIGCLVRWIRDGVKGPDGERVRLEAVRFGNKWLTSRQAIARFVTALTPRVGGEEETPAPRTPGARQRSSQRAAKELEAVGI